MSRRVVKFTVKDGELFSFLMGCLREVVNKENINWLKRKGIQGIHLGIIVYAKS